jgi:5-(carboxyamino)imidazole ribonucleotide mutase
MPAGIPVATVSIDGARNAGILAARIIGTNDEKVAAALATFSESLKDQVAIKNQNLKSQI